MRPEQDADRLIRADEAARRLGVDVTTLERWHAHRVGPAAVCMPDRSLAYSHHALESWQDRLGAATAACRARSADSLA